MRSRFRLLLALLVAVLAFSTLTVEAQIISGNGRTVVNSGDHADVQTTNFTKYDSWVDISWSYALQGWHIEKAFCLKPLQTYNYRVSYNHPGLQPRVRVRAEIKLAGCAAGTHAVVSGSGHVIKNNERFVVGIHEDRANHFSMSFPSTF